MLLFVEKVFHIPSTDKDIWGYDDHVLIHPVGNMYNIIIPYKYAYYVNKTIGMFNGKFADKTNIYYVEGNNRLSPRLQPLTTGSVL